MHQKRNLRSGDFFYFLAGEKNTKIAWSQVTKNEENRLNNRAGKCSHHSCWCIHLLFVVFIRLFCGFFFFLLLLFFFVFLSGRFPIICNKKPFPFLIQNARKQTQNNAETHEILRRISEFPWTNYGCFSRHLYLGLQKCRFFSFAHDGLRKQLTFRDATTGFPAKWPLNQISHAARPIGSTTRISSEWDFCARFSNVGKSRLFSQATLDCETRSLSFSS